jgi:hypothetical protein
MPTSQQNGITETSHTTEFLLSVSNVDLYLTAAECNEILSQNRATDPINKVVSPI